MFNLRELLNLNNSDPSKQKAQKPAPASTATPKQDPTADYGRQLQAAYREGRINNQQFGQMFNQAIGKPSSNLLLDTAKGIGSDVINAPKNVGKSLWHTAALVPDTVRLAAANNPQAIANAKADYKQNYAQSLPNSVIDPFSRVPDRIGTGLPGGRNLQSNLADYVGATADAYKTTADAYKQGRVSKDVLQKALDEHNSAIQQAGAENARINKNTSIKQATLSDIPAVASNALGGGRAAAAGVEASGVTTGLVGKLANQLKSPTLESYLPKAVDKALFSTAPGIRGAFSTGARLGAVTGTLGAFNSDHVTPGSIAQGAFDSAAQQGLMGAGLHAGGELFGKATLKSRDNKANEVGAIGKDVNAPTTKLIPQEPTLHDPIKKAKADIAEAKTLRDKAPAVIPPEEHAFGDVKDKAWYDRYIKDTEAYIAKKQTQPTLPQKLQEHFTKNYTPSTNHPDEAFAADYFSKNPDKALQAYQERTSKIFGSKNIVAGDDAKYAVPNMDPSKSMNYHEPASIFAKGYYEHLLSDPTTTDKPVMITAGGTGAGKTSALKQYFNDKSGNANDYAAIIDTNLTTPNSAISRIEPALASGRPVAVKFVYRDPVEAFQNGVIPRAAKEGRVVDAPTHADTHANSLDTIKQIAEKYKDNPNVTIEVIDNSRGAGNSTVVPLDFLKDKSYTKSELEAKIHQLLDSQLQEGKLNNEQHQQFKGTNTLDQGGSHLQAVEPPGNKETLRQPQQERQSGPLAPPIEPSFSPKQYIKEQTNLQKAAAKGDKVPFRTRLRDDFAVKGIDALTPIEKPVEKALGGREHNVALRNQLDRSLRSDTIGGQFVKDNGLDKVIKAVPDTKAFDQYLIAKHAAELEFNSIKTGRDPVKDAALVKELAPQYEQHAKAISKYSNKLLDKTVEYGLISKETGDLLKQLYPDYVPFNRIFTDAEMTTKGNGTGPASLSTQTVIQRIKGSDRQIHSPLESLLAKTHDVVAQGERNLAAKAVVDTRTIPGNPLQLKELKPNETIGNKSTISYIENGVKRTFETTPEVAQAAKSLNKQQLGLVGKILSYPTRLLRLGATGANVAFTAANVVKDIGSGFINSEHPIESIANPKTFVEALQAAFKHSGKNYSELVREGAGGTSFDIGRNAAPETLAKIRASRNAPSKVLYTVTHPGELLRAVEDTIGRSEEFGRAEQYFGNKRAKLKEGATFSEATAYAADAARSNTTNFARAGEYGRVLNSVLPYFNAGLQGSRTLLRNVRDKPLQTGTKVLLTAFLPVAATTAWALSDPKRKEAYDDIPDYEKQGNIIIVPPNPKKDANGRWNVIKIPVSQEIANLNSTVRNGVEALAKDKGFDFKAMAGDLAGTVTSVNSGSARQLENQVIPQGVKPIIETTTNQNLFTGNPIVSPSQKNLEPKDQYNKGTSATAKAIGSKTNLSPSQIDNAYRTATGGLGQNLLNFSDRLIASKPEDVKGTSLDTGIKNRFYTAKGTSDYEKTDKLAQAKIKELQSSAGYKSLSQDDKRKAVNRLQNAAISGAQAQLGINKTPPTAREKGVADGSVPVTDFLAPSTKSTTKTTDPKVKYQNAVTKYNTDKKAGTITPVQDITRQKTLSTLKFNSTQDPTIAALHALSKTDAYNYIIKQPNADELAKKLLQYDQAAKDAGIQSYTKFIDKKGAPSIKPTVKKITVKKTKFNYAKGLSSTSKSFKTAALRNIVKKNRITRRKLA